ncbi:SWI/SNF complex 60 kDa subunit [Globomyces pollinis-pini]|nr:SWI/SNF complex 60 kDa subunit [Globomyces pollinis-pini]
MDAYVPESRLFMQIQEFERRLDATITRKTLDIQDALAKPPKRINRTLRIFLSNTSANQPYDPVDESVPLPDRVPSWTFKIEGRLLDAPNTRKQPEYQPKFSSFFKSIMIEIERDNTLYPGNHIQWNNSVGGTEMDGFEVKRRGDAEVNLKILLQLDNVPEKHKLSPGLAKLLDIHSDTLPNVIMAVWQYIKAHRLQDAEDRRVIICDDKLTQIFGSPKILFPSIPELLGRHLFPCDPIVLNFTVRVDKEYHMNTQAFDINVTVPDPIRERYNKVAVGNASVQREISQLDDKISALIQSINLAKLKRDFMASFVENPVKFINDWIGSQSRDLEVILGDTRINTEEAKQTEFFENDAFKEALFHYLRQKEMR